MPLLRTAHADLAFASDVLDGCDDMHELVQHLRELSDDAVVQFLARVSGLIRELDALRITASGVVASRSHRDGGQGGLAQARGHRSPESLIQEVTGCSRSQATAQVRLAQTMDASRADEADTPASHPWDAGLGRGLISGSLSAAQADAIRRGLGTPPVIPGFGDDAILQRATIEEAWAVAVDQLVEESRVRSVEELARSARTIRDVLDPDGAVRRFDERFERRSARMWVDADGVSRASITFDDEMAAWWTAIIDAALRPRRGGPRFVDPDEQSRAADLLADPRTNDQLTYDLIMDTLRAGALADAAAVFGTRQAGVRIVLTAASRVIVPAVEDDVASPGAPAWSNAIAQVADTGATLPAWIAERAVCESGKTTCITTRSGDPLVLGREARLFSPKQRIGLALRDGGCRWPGCDRPPSGCEAHHIDAFAAGGRTDVDRGILLCRFHHMNLHHHGWRITRDGTHDFRLHPPGDEPARDLRRRRALAYAWGDITPPTVRFRPETRTLSAPDKRRPIPTPVF